MENKYSLYEFHYVSFELIPIGKIPKTSTQLLYEIMKHIDSPEFTSNRLLIDKHINREKISPRKLIIVSTRFTKDRKRCFGRIALIKNKAPMLLNKENIVEEINKQANQKYVDITNFVVHFSVNSDPIMMVEFNNDGPRIDDIEFYFRRVGRTLNNNRKIQASLHLDTDIKGLEKNIKNVFNIKVKVDSPNINKINWFRAYVTPESYQGVKEVSLNFGYEKTKNAIGNFIHNTSGTDRGREIVSWINNDPNNIRYLGDMKMEYLEEGQSIPTKFDFIKNKKTSFVAVDKYDGYTVRKQDLIEKMSIHLNHFLKTKQTYSDKPDETN